MWDWLEKHRKPILLFLVALLLIGGAVFAYRQLILPPGQLLEISPQEITVYIDGAVEHPGFYKISSDAQLIDLLNIAGIAPDANLSGVNLAQRLWDGDQIRIYKIGELLPQKVNINTADTWLLEALPGIGEVRAGEIIESRKNDGLFMRPYELVERGLISQSVFDSIKDFITV
jgi:competence protein ComEA